MDGRTYYIGSRALLTDYLLPMVRLGTPSAGNRVRVDRQFLWVKVSNVVGHLWVNVCRTAWVYMALPLLVIRALWRLVTELLRWISTAPHLGLGL